MRRISVFHAPLESLTDKTLQRVADYVACDGATHTQSWEWRGCEAAVLVGAGLRRNETIVIIRRGLRAGDLIEVRAGSVAAALRALGIEIRVGQRRRWRGNDHSRALARIVRQLRYRRTWKWLDA
jgi:hypothetical protein